MQGALPSVSAVLHSEPPLALLRVVPGMTCPCRQYAAVVQEELC